MLQIELKLIKSKKLILPVALLFLAIVFTAFVLFWIGVKQKELTGAELSEFIAIRATQSAVTPLLFLFWMLQYSVHLQISGFYKMLLIFGWKREKLFLFTLFQLGFYTGALMLLIFFCYAVMSFFFGTNPIQLILNSGINPLISQYFYLYAIGLFGVVFSFIRSNYLLILPVFMYWLFEGWLSSFILKHYEFGIGNYFPLQSIKQIISEHLLNDWQTFAIGVYVFLFFMILHISIQKKMFI